MTTILRFGATALDGFAKIAGETGGVDVRALDPFVSLLVRTKNSTYPINKFDGTAAIVRGDHGRQLHQARMDRRRVLSRVHRRWAARHHHARPGDWHPASLRRIAPA